MIAIMSDPISRLFDDARRQPAASGATLFLTGTPVREMIFVASGEVHLIRHTAAGDRLILHRAGQGAVLAEASAYSAHYHCDAVVTKDGVLATLPKAVFLDALSADAALSSAWAAFLARATQGARLRAEIRSLPRVAARLAAWLEAGNALPEKGRWQDVAAELGVTREALYRELARRRPA